VANSFAAVGLTAAVALVGIELARVGDLGPGLQQTVTNFDNWVTKIFGGSPGGTGTSPPGTGSPGCWDSTKAGLPACVGTAWCQSHSAPPPDIPSLESWGNSNGLRNPSTGVWSC